VGLTRFFLGGPVRIGGRILVLRCNSLLKEIDILLTFSFRCATIFPTNIPTEAIDEVRFLLLLLTVLPNSLPRNPRRKLASFCHRVLLQDEWDMPTNSTAL